MSPSAGRVVPQKVNFWGQGNKEGSPRLPLGEERTNILLLACCYQEGSNPKGCQVAPAAEIASDCGYSAVARPSSGGHATRATTKRVGGTCGGRDRKRLRLQRRRPSVFRGSREKCNHETWRTAE